MTDEEKPPGRRGRPPGSGSGETPIRHVRIGPLWDRAEELALRRARREGTVIQRKDRKTGEVKESGNVSAFVERALRREVELAERQEDRLDQQATSGE